MSRMLAELLGVGEISFHLNIEQLEKASGRPSADIRLTTEIIQNTKRKIKGLGLDPDDTTPRELYEMLVERLRGDNDRLESALIHQKENNKITSRSLAQTLEALSIPKNCFAIKHSVAKKILKKVPPTLTLKQLGYRSLDSLLKRESATAVFLSAKLIESPNWQRKVAEQYKHLKPSDFETRKIEIYSPKTQRWEQLSSELSKKERSTVAICKELGGLIILPLPLDMPGSTLATLALSLYAINDIRIHSAFSKLQLVKPNFGEIIANTMVGDVKALALVAGLPLPWHIIQKHYSRLSHSYPLELFEPHIYKEDLQLIGVEEVLSYLEPTLDFWQGTNYLGFSDKGQAVSLNLTDVAINSCNKFVFDQRITTYFREELWAELILKYLQQAELEQTLVQQLDAELIGDQNEAELLLSMVEAN